jgi:hypothetical protein
VPFGLRGDFSWIAGSLRTVSSGRLKIGVPNEVSKFSTVVGINQCISIFNTKGTYTLDKAQSVPKGVAGNYGAKIT